MANEDHINGLPDEILGKIFQRACPTIDLQGWPRRTPYIGHLSRVCTRWRFIVVNDPKLWSNLLLHTHPGPVGKLSIYLVDVIQLALQRSQNYPLTIRFTATCKENARKFEKSFEPLYVAAHRWCDVELDGLLFSLMVERNWTKWSKARSPMPILRSLHFARCHHCDSLLGKFMGLSTGTLPALTHLTLDRFASISNLAGQLTNRGFPWHQLTHLCLRDGNQRAWMEVGSIDDFFRQVPNLVELIIQPLVYPLRRKKSGVVLPKLKSLSFSVEYGIGTPSRDAWRAALSFLEAPNLSTLNISIDSDMDASIVRECVPPFLQSSQCALKGMSLVNIPTSLTNAILGYTPSLEHLSIIPPLPSLNREPLEEVLPTISQLTNLPSITFYLDTLDSRLISSISSSLLERRPRSSRPSLDSDLSQSTDPEKKSLQDVRILYRAGRGNGTISTAAFRQIWGDCSLEGGLVPVKNFPAKDDLRGLIAALSELRPLS